MQEENMSAFTKIFSEIFDNTTLKNSKNIQKNKFILIIIQK